MRSPAFAAEAHHQSLAVATSPHAKEDQDFMMLCLWASNLRHHRMMFDAAHVAPGPAASSAKEEELHHCDYAPVAAKTDADEIVEQAETFLEFVQPWIAAHHAKLV